jgi:rare lipoprotein A (peptidoglycan hydrolase)
VLKSRIIDLSYSAAKMLGMGHDGVDPVRLDVVETPVVAENEGPQ